MQQSKDVFKNAWPYQQDAMNLPVADVAASIPFYQTIFDFKFLSQTDIPVKSAILGRMKYELDLQKTVAIPRRTVVFLKLTIQHWPMRS